MVVGVVVVAVVFVLVVVVVAVICHFLYASLSNICHSESINKAQ